MMLLPVVSPSPFPAAVASSVDSPHHSVSLRKTASSAHFAASAYPPCCHSRRRGRGACSGGSTSGLGFQRIKMKSDLWIHAARKIRAEDRDFAQNEQQSFVT